MGGFVGILPSLDVLGARVPHRDAVLPALSAAAASPRNRRPRWPRTGWVTTCSWPAVPPTAPGSCSRSPAISNSAPKSSTLRSTDTPCTRMATLTAPKSARLLARDRRPAPYPAHRWATPSRPLASRQPLLPAWTRYAPGPRARRPDASLSARSTPRRGPPSLELPRHQRRPGRRGPGRRPRRWGRQTQALICPSGGDAARTSAPTRGAVEGQRSADRACAGPVDKFPAETP